MAGFGRVVVDHLDARVGQVAHHRFELLHLAAGAAHPMHGLRTQWVHGGQSYKEEIMIVLGLVLLVVGFLFHVSILWTLGIILLVIGAILAILGGTGRMVGGRAHWY
jgi:hypothetical protein